jgi:hypothetical protein
LKICVPWSVYELMEWFICGWGHPFDRQWLSLRRHFALIAFWLIKKFAVAHTSPYAELGGQRPEGTIAKTVMRRLHAGTPGDIVPHSIWLPDLSPNSDSSFSLGDPNNWITE